MNQTYSFTYKIADNYIKWGIFGGLLDESVVEYRVVVFLPKNIVILLYVAKHKNGKLSFICRKSMCTSKEEICKAYMNNGWEQSNPYHAIIVSYLVYKQKVF